MVHHIVDNNLSSIVMAIQRVIHDQLFDVLKKKLGRDVCIDDYPRCLRMYEVESGYTYLYYDGEFVARARCQLNADESKIILEFENNKTNDPK